jgi:hypothetical protein
VKEQMTRQGKASEVGLKEGRKGDETGVRNERKKMW